MRKLLPLTVAAGIAAWFFARHPRGKVLFGKLHGKFSSVVPKQYDDATLKDKVESELFRDEHEVKGAINVNAQEGVVQLRGTAALAGSDRRARRAHTEDPGRPRGGEPAAHTRHRSTHASLSRV